MKSIQDFLASLRQQDIKIWADGERGFHQRVYDVAGGANGAAVNADNCAVSGPGHSQMCTTWRDPDFDPDQPVAYYLRALENPSCRWTWRQCLSLPVEQRPSACTDPTLPRVIQERAWSSPVWYTPSDD